jgi:hypothetical protein
MITDTINRNITTVYSRIESSAKCLHGRIHELVDRIDAIEARQCNCTKAEQYHPITKNLFDIFYDIGVTCDTGLLGVAIAVLEAVIEDYERHNVSPSVAIDKHLIAYKKDLEALLLPGYQE